METTIIETSSTYSSLLEHINSTMSQAQAHVEKLVERQVLQTNWRVGEAISHYVSEGNPHTDNARLIGQLADDLQRPRSHFYGVLKFYRLYPEIPQGETLTWSHYKVLMRIADSTKRKEFEHQAFEQGLSWKNLQKLINSYKEEIKQDSLQVRASDSEEGSKLKIPRHAGQLYHYRLTNNKSLKLGRRMMLLDVGFDMRREIYVDMDRKAHAGHFVRTVKYEDDYQMRVTGISSSQCYTYKAFVERILSPTELLVNLDLGFKIWKHQKVKLRGINIEQHASQQAQKVIDMITAALDQTQHLIIKTYQGPDNQDYLADVFYEPNQYNIFKVAQSGRFLNQEILDAVLGDGG